VLDEFDKSLEMGFEEEISFIVNALTHVETRILVSATDLEVLPEFIHQHTFHKINYLPEGFNAPIQLNIQYISCNDRDKAEKLFELVCMSEGGPVIVFCNYREAVDRMSKFLSDKGVSNIGYHGAMEQDKRDTALFKFRSGSVQVLVTTDIASRGFDIKDVETIIHYQLPQTQEIFIHRNGRTARMNASGNAILMIGQEEHLPPYLEQEVPLLALPTTISAPATPQWVSLFIAAGKKEKINKVDIVGFLGHKGLLKKEEIGIIEVKDHHSFVAIAANKVRNALPLLKNERIKNQKVRIDIAR
jgi:superfamily II DNA/RNA helicase